MEVKHLKMVVKFVKCLAGDVEEVENPPAIVR
jgi:hypothetical protein